LCQIKSILHDLEGRLKNAAELFSKNPRNVFEHEIHGLQFVNDSKKVTEQIIARIFWTLSANKRKALTGRPPEDGHNFLVPNLAELSDAASTGRSYVTL
jgi:hypothetical protein